MAQVNQLTVALESASARGRKLELERTRYLSAEREATGVAVATTSHLARLQRVTAALSEAGGMAAVSQVVTTDIREATGASEVLLALCPGTDGVKSEEGAPVTSGEGTFASGEGTRSDLPLEVTGRRIGTVTFRYARNRPLTPSLRALTEDMARQLALAVDREITRDLLQQAMARSAIEPSATVQSRLTQLARSLKPKPRE